MSNNDVSINAKISKEVKDKLYEYCKENDLSMAHVIRKAINRYLEEIGKL